MMGMKTLAVKGLTGIMPSAWFQANAKLCQGIYHIFLKGYLVYPVLFNWFAQNDAVAGNEIPPA